MLMFLILFLIQLSCQQDSCSRNDKISYLTSLNKREMARRMDAMWGLFVGDSLAMPVHWYYRPNDIKSGYGGWIKEYKAPAAKHPSSILTISAPDGSGRKGHDFTSKKSVVGDVILHDKLKYWTSRDHTIHYHQGMEAGDSTLNALVAMETAKVLQEVDPKAEAPASKVYEAVMENYIKFMTTPGTHNDTYAESFHRSYFQEWINHEHPPTKGSVLVDQAMRRFKSVIMEDHQLPVIGAMVLAIPWILHYSSLTEQECKDRTVGAIKLTHPAPSLMPYVELYTQILYRVLHGGNLREEIMAAAGHTLMGTPNKAKVIIKFSSAAKGLEGEEKIRLCQEAAAILGMACYIQGAMGTMMFLAYEFHEDFVGGVLMNANCGGENAHRGSALGALLAAHMGVPDEWKTGLKQASNIKKLESKWQ